MIGSNKQPLQLESCEGRRSHQIHNHDLLSGVPIELQINGQELEQFF